MKFNLSIVKKHPVAFGVGAVAVVGVILLASRGGGSTSTGTTSDPAAVAMAQQTSSQNFQLAMVNAQMAGQQQLAEMNYSLNMYQAQQDSALATLGLQVQKELTKYTTDMNFASQQATYAYQLASQKSSEQSAFGLAQLQTNAMMNMAELQATQNMFALQTTSDLQKSLAQINADVTKHSATLNYKLGSKQSDNQLIGGLLNGLMGAFL